VKNAEAIAATPGVDLLWVGHFDLSQTMGIPAQFQHPDFLAALRAVVAAGKKHGKHLGIQPSNTEQCEQWMGLGFDVISWAVDSMVYRNALVSAVAALRNR
jgi:4-hydroxy-2-oxoheptanedioate aldolase